MKNMKKIPLMVFAAVMSAAPLAAQQQQSLEQALGSGAEYFRRQLPRNARIIVLPPESPTEALGMSVVRSFQTLLVNTGSFTVLERDPAGLAAAERELGYHMTGMVSDETALGIGKMLGAELALAGRIVQEAGGYRLELRAVEVETGRIAGSWAASGIRRDAALTALDPPLRAQAVLEFAGNLRPDGMDQDALFEEVLTALQRNDVALDLLEQPETGTAVWRIVITTNGRERAAAPPANTPLITGDFSIAFYRERRNVRQSKRKSISEIDREHFFRRALGEIQAENDFFLAIKKELPRQGQ
jgi:hypothetical protein